MIATPDTLLRSLIRPARCYELNLHPTLDRQAQRRPTIALLRGRVQRIDHLRELVFGQGHPFERRARREPADGLRHH